MDYEKELNEALTNVLWKLERKEESGGKCKWAKIDRNDAVIRSAHRLLCKIAVEKLNV